MKKFLLILLIFASTNVFAALNKWTDANGKVHYSDLPPPPNVKAKVLRSTPVDNSIASASGVAASSASAAPKTLAEVEAEFKKAKQAKKDLAERAAQEQAKADANKTRCAALQQNILALQSGTRIQIFAANGERAYMDDNRRQQDLAKAQQDYNASCI